MKLGIILPHLRTGGIERGMVQLFPYFLAAGFELTLFLQSRDGDLLGTLPAEIKVVDFAGAGVWKGGKLLAAHLRHNPIDVLWTATNAANILSLTAVRRLGRNKPKVIIGEHIPLDAFIATRKFPWVRRALMKALYPAATAITAPIEPILDEHRDLLGRRCPVGVMLPNPVVDTVVKGRKVPNRAKRFVTLGRLSPEKDYGLALAIFAELAKSDPDCTLTLFGEGSERTKLENQIQTLGIAERVSMPGPAPDAKTAFAQADMLWCTSKVEGFGNVIVEAFGEGVSVASVDCPFGPPVLLDGGKAGCLMTGRDPKSLAADIAKFAADREKRLTAQMAGYETAEEFTREASAQAHLAFFRSL